MFMQAYTIYSGIPYKISQIYMFMKPLFWASALLD